MWQYGEKFLVELRNIPVLIKDEEGRRFFMLSKETKGVFSMSMAWDKE